MPVKSISELRGELLVKERQLKRLKSRRSGLARQLDAVDRRIGALTGRARDGRRKVKKRKKRRKPVRRKARRGRPKKARAKKRVWRKRATGKPLAAYIREVLAKAAGGLSVTNVTKAVGNAGYRSHSKDFYAIVAKTLLTNKGFRRIKRGVYKLAG